MGKTRIFPEYFPKITKTLRIPRKDLAGTANFAGDKRYFRVKN